MCSSVEEHDKVLDDFSILPAFRNYTVQNPMNTIAYCANKEILPLQWHVMRLNPSAYKKLALLNIQLGRDGGREGREGDE